MRCRFVPVTADPFSLKCLFRELLILLENSRRCSLVGLRFKCDAIYATQYTSLVLQTGFDPASPP